MNNINNLNRVDKVEPKNRIKNHSQMIYINSNNYNICNLRYNPNSIQITENLSFNELQLNQHYYNNNNYYYHHNNLYKHFQRKNDISFKNDNKINKNNSNSIINHNSNKDLNEVNNLNNFNGTTTNNNNNINLSQSCNTICAFQRNKQLATNFIISSNTKFKINDNNILKIRKAFFNIKKKNTNSTPNKKRFKSPQTLNLRTNIKTHSSQILNDLNFANKKNEKFIISTLPRAIIDISKTDSLSHGLNITYNNEEIINFYLKLQSKNTKISQEMIKELELLRDDINLFIDKYNYK